MISKRVFLDHSLEDLCINSFVHNAPFLYPLKTSENLNVFWYFKGALGVNVKAKVNVTAKDVLRNLPKSMMEVFPGIVYG